MKNEESKKVIITLMVDMTRIECQSDINIISRSYEATAITYLLPAPAPVFFESLTY